MKRFFVLDGAGGFIRSESVGVSAWQACTAVQAVAY
jgi:hypothetical protein